jgi:methylphosphotriester-DNA--protein-cysteine methyltransferase
MSYTTDAARWRALATRDANANGHFFYSVKSTQIYCRPTCPARLARRANISFQKTIAEAEALGFRACKRCKPNADNEDPQDKAVAKACSYIEDTAREGNSKVMKLHDLAKRVGLTPRYFHKIFKDKTGVTPREYTNIVAAQQSNSCASSGSGSTPSDVESFDWDSFDISELADFQFDSNASLDGDYMAQAAQISAAGFGEASLNEMPLRPWPTASSKINNSDIDSTLSKDQASSSSVLDTPSIAFGQCQDGLSMPMDSAFDFDLTMLLQNDMAETGFSADAAYDFGLSHLPIVPGSLS